MGCCGLMKTTIELPDSLLRRAKMTAAQQGQTMTAFMKAALEARLSASESAQDEQPWMRYAGIFSDPEDTTCVMEGIEEAFGTVDSADWE